MKSLYSIETPKSPDAASSLPRKYSERIQDEPRGIKPMFWKKPASVTVNRGDLITFECRLMADPPPKVITIARPKAGCTPVTKPAKYILSFSAHIISNTFQNHAIK